MTVVATLNELTDRRYRRGYWQLRYFQICYKLDGKLYWKFLRSSNWLRLGTGYSSAKTKKALKRRAEKEGYLVLTNVFHHAKVLMSHAKAITKIPIPYCMDMLMEMDHPYWE